MINIVEAGEDRDLLCAAAEVVIRTQIATPQHLQRKARVGWVKANRLLDLLEAAGVVGPVKPIIFDRDVLVPVRLKLEAVDALRRGVAL